MHRSNFDTNLVEVAKVVDVYGVVDEVEVVDIDDTLCKSFQHLNKLNCLLRSSEESISCTE